jgi:hypothetical protein
MASEQQHFDAARKFQEFYDNTLRKVGMRAPQPVLGQKVNDYRRETLRTIKRTFLPQNHQFYKMQMRRLPDDVLPGFEPQILQAAVDAANSPVGMAPDELRKIEEFDEYGQVKVIRFVGPDSFVKSMGRPGRRVASFWTEQGPVSASGRYLR